MTKHHVLTFRKFPSSLQSVKEANLYPEECIYPYVLNSDGG